MCVDDTQMTGHPLQKLCEAIFVLYVSYVQFDVRRAMKCPTKQLGLGKHPEYIAETDRRTPKLRWRNPAFIVGVLVLTSGAMYLDQREDEPFLSSIGHHKTNRDQNRSSLV